MLKSLTAQANSLRAMYGDDRAAHMPATIYVHLYTADPDNGGTELAEVGGYTPLAMANTSANFPDPDADALLESADFVWTSTGAWSAVAKWAQLSDGAGNLYDGGPLGRRVNVTQAGVEVRINARIFYNDLGA